TEYLRQLASSAPTPGGGAAAALNAAQGAALVAMVVRLSKEPGVDWNQWAQRMDAAADAFQSLMDEDARAFQSVMDAMQSPKSDPDRTERLQKALKNAANPPLLTMERAWDLLNSLDQIIP